jgi:archaellin
MFLFLVAGAFSSQLTLKKVAAKKVQAFPKLTIQIPSSIAAGSDSIDLTATVAAHDGDYYVFLNVDQGDTYYFTKPFGTSSKDVSVETPFPLTQEQSAAGNHIFYAQICSDDYEYDCDEWIQTKFVAK